MFKAIQSYADKSSSNYTLSFNAGDLFCIVEKTNSSWWLASNSNGQIGYVPTSYLKSHEKDASKSIVLESIDRAIASVSAKSASGVLTKEQQNMLRKLNEHKQNVIAASSSNKEHGKRPAPPPPTRATEVVRAVPPPPTRLSKRQAPPQPVASTSQLDARKDVDHNEKEKLDKDNSSLPAGNSSSDNVVLPSFAPKIPVQLGSELISKLQLSCHLNESKARDFTRCLLDSIGESVPELMKIMQEIVETLPEVQPIADPFKEKLQLALANITEIRDDGQQNNWAIEDDVDKISGILNEIMEALTSADKSDSIAEFRYNDCEYLNVLATYHQMESRVSLRLLVLQIVGVVCSLSNSLVSVLMTTVLPLELVQDIQAHTDDIQRVCYSALVLSMLFSTGEPIPLSYYDTMNEKFLSFLIDSVEHGLSGDDEDRVGDIFVRLILAINLHFIVPEDNLVMKAISNSRCTALGEKIMLLINRGDDPVRITTDAEDSEPPDSVLKFFQDVFSRSDTALSFLYTNDLFVLIDIIARNLADLPSGVKTRTDYLDLLLNVLERSSYRENRHRSSEILTILERIEQEELPAEDGLQRVTAEFDKTIVKKILQEQSSCFA